MRLLWVTEQLDIREERLKLAFSESYLTSKQIEAVFGRRSKSIRQSHTPFHFLLVGMYPQTILIICTRILSAVQESFLFLACPALWWERTSCQSCLGPECWWKEAWFSSCNSTQKDASLLPVCPVVTGSSVTFSISISPRMRAPQGVIY